MLARTMSFATARKRRRHDAAQRSEALKERVYVTFTSLAVTIALQREAGDTTVFGAATTLVLTVVGTLLAVLVSDLLAYLTRHDALPDKTGIKHLLWVSFGSLNVVIVPLLTLGSAGTGWLDLSTALRLNAFVLVATLTTVTFVAIRRLHVGKPVKVAVLSGVTLLGVAALAVDLSVH